MNIVGKMVGIFYLWIVYDAFRLFESGIVCIDSRWPVMSEAAQRDMLPGGVRVSSYQAVVTIRGLDEDLRLTFACYLPFHFLEFGSSLLGVDRQVAVEGKALSVESRTPSGPAAGLRGL